MKKKYDVEKAFQNLPAFLYSRSGEAGNSITPRLCDRNRDKKTEGPSIPILSQAAMTKEMCTEAFRTFFTAHRPCVSSRPRDSHTEDREPSRC